MGSLIPPGIIKKKTLRSGILRRDSLQAFTLLPKVLGLALNIANNRSYFKDGGTLQAMTNEELVIRIQQGGDHREELEELYNQNRGIIARIVNHYHGNEDEEDLFQEAYFGIVAAAELWRPEEGASFATYAVYWIKQVLRRYIDNCGSLIRIPVHQKERIILYRKTIAEFRKEFGRDPVPLELMRALGVSFGQIQDITKDAQALQVRSLSEELGEDGNTLQDVISDPEDKIEAALDRIGREQLSSLLWSLVDTLEKEQAHVVRERYQNGKTLEECGKEIGCTRERVRQIEAKAMRKLRSPEINKKLRPYLDVYSIGLRGGLNSFRHSFTSSTEYAALCLIKDEAPEGF